MAQVKSKGNRSTEGRLIKAMRGSGITGWSRTYPLLGRPDFVFRRARLAVFVDGCFWHGHATNCRLPQANRTYWRQKIARNKARDKLVTKTLRQRGWKVIRIWEHCVEKPSTVTRLRKALK